MTFKLSDLDRFETTAASKYWITRSATLVDIFEAYGYPTWNNLELCALFKSSKQTS